MIVDMDAPDSIRGAIESSRSEERNFLISSEFCPSEAHFTHAMATRLGTTLNDARRNKLWWLKPNEKIHVTIQYKQNADGSVPPCL